MSEGATWLDSIPWPKIGGAIGSAALVVAGGLWKDAVDEKLETAKSPSTLQQEHTARHFNWKDSCPVIGEDDETGAQLRKCPNDDCLMFIVVRGGLRQVFFSVAPDEIPTAPMILGGPWFDWPAGEVYAAYPQTCLSDHGAPNGDPPLSDGADLGNGWLWQYANYRDGCRMARQFHRPTQSATAWAWERCAEQHH